MVSKIKSFIKIRSNQKINHLKICRVIKKHSSLFAPGKYKVYFGKDKTVLYLRSLDEKHRNWLLNISDYSNAFQINQTYVQYAKRLIIKQFGYKKRIKISSHIKSDNYSKFQGSAMMLLADKKSLKVFDFNAEKTLTLMSNSKSYLKRLAKAHAIFKDDYKTTIESIDLDNMKIKESLLLDANKMDVEITGDNAIHTVKKIIPKQVNIIKKQLQESEYKTLREFVSSEAQYKYVDTFFSLVGNEYKNLLDIKLPFIHQHGDLIYQNILISGEEWFLIDFEHANKLPMFYDVLFFIISPTWIKNWENHDLIDLYFKGSFDNELTSLFKIFKMDISLMDDKINSILLTILARRLIVDENAGASALEVKAEKDYFYLTKIIKQN